MHQLSFPSYAPQYKSRNYGDTDIPGAKPAEAGKPVCAKYKPDGFGGKVCRDEEIKPLINKVIDGVTSSDDFPPPPPRAAPAAAPERKKSVGESTRSSGEAEKPLTLEDLIEKSIQNKEVAYGRALTSEEKMEVAAKVTKLLGK